jgi:hypothetical protein
MEHSSITDRRYHVAKRSYCRLFCGLTGESAETFDTREWPRLAALWQQAGGVLPSKWTASHLGWQRSTEQEDRS